MMTPERLAEIRRFLGVSGAVWNPQTYSGYTESVAADLLAEVDRLRAQVAGVEDRYIIGVVTCAHDCDATVFICEGDTWKTLDGWLLTTGSGWACPKHRDRS